MIRKQLICYLLMTLLVVPIAWSQERAIRPVAGAVDPNVRQALVIGNSEYRHAGRLRNPVNDARAIGNTLQQLGFEVTTLVDADQRKMEGAIRAFGDELRSRRGVGLFYYAGHGMQFDGENYLLPTDVNPSTEDDVRYDAVPLGKMLSRMRDANNGMNVVILDACRNNPFSRSFRTFSPGLAQVNTAAGTFMSFATAPGQVAADGDGNNGLFTSKLLEHLQTPGLKIEEVFKRTTADVYTASNERQAPWVQYSVIGDFFFVPRVKPPQVPNQTALSDLQERADAEQSERLEQQRLEAEWKEWQQKMQEDYERVLAFEKQAVGNELKIESWQRFLGNWTDDNPYSQQDSELRSGAQSKVSYWGSTQKSEQKQVNLLRPWSESPNSPQDMSAILDRLDQQRFVERAYNSLLYEQLRGQINAGPQFDKKLSIAIEIQIELDGSVSAYRIKESSGSKQFDLVVMTGMKAITFPRLPKELGKNPPYIVTIRIYP